MRFISIILLLFPFLVSGQEVINLSPDSTLYDLHLLPGTAVAPPIPFDSSNFYVNIDSVGDGSSDLNSGTHPDSAWATINKVNNSTFDPNDTIFFNKGDIWRETLIVPSSGTAGNLIVLTSYGTGDNPKILGSELATGFTAHPSIANVWLSADNFSNPSGVSNGVSAWVEETSGLINWVDSVTPTAGFALLDAEYKFTWQNDTFYIYAESDPDVRYTKTEVGQRIMCADLNAQEFLTFDNIDMFFAETGILEVFPSAGKTGLEIRNSEFAYFGEKDDGGYAIHVVYNDMIFEDNISHDNGRRGVSIINYGATDISNIIIRNNIFYNGFHTTGPDIETGGTGGATGDLDSLMVYGNLVYDSSNTSIRSAELIFAQGPHGGTGQIFGLYVFNNILVYPSAQALELEDVDESFVYNNTFYGINQVATSNIFHVFYTDGSTNSVLKNNIFYNDGDFGVNTTAISVVLDATMAWGSVDADSNLYYTQSGGLDIVRQVGGDQYLASEIADLTTDHGWENSQLVGNPLVFTNDYNTRTDAPGIGASEDLSAVFTDDYYGTTRTTWNNGAVESIRDGDTTQVFTISSTKKDTILVDATIFTKQPDSLRLVWDEGNDSIGEGGGTTLYAGTDTTAVQNAEFETDVSTDTIVRAELWHWYDGVRSLYGNVDITNVDSLGVAFAYQSEFYSDTVLARWSNDPTPQGTYDLIFDTFYYALDTITDAGTATSVLRLADLMYQLASHNTDDSRINVAIEGGFTLTAGAAGLTFTQYNGWTGDGAGYFTTGWNPTDDAVNFALDDASMGVMVNHDVVDAGEMEMGVNDGNNDAYLFTQFTSEIRGGRLNSDAAVQDSDGNAAIFLVVIRPDNTQIKSYYDGTSPQTTADASIGIPNDDVYIFCRNDAPATANFFSTKEISFVYWGGELTATQIASFDIVLDWFKAAMGF